MNDISKNLKRLRNEDFIWIVYFFIVVFALYSNKLDRDYLLKKDNEAYKREKYINITIFFIAFFIYLYFLLLLTFLAHRKLTLFLSYVFFLWFHYL